MPPQQPALQRLISDTGVPFEYKCPITAEIMEDPVVIADGRTYERAAIEQWLARSNLSPMTGGQLDHRMCVPNDNLRILIRGFVAARAVRPSTASATNRAGESAELREVRNTLERVFEEDLQLVVESIEKISVGSLVERFEAKKREIGGEVVRAYHGTSHDTAASIAESGFRLPEPDEDGDFIGGGIRTTYDGALQQDEYGHGDNPAPLMFGGAIYLSPELAKATKFAQGALIVCDCAVGNALVLEEANYKMAPAMMAQMGFHSIYGQPDCEGMGGVRYAEYAFFHEHQVLPRYLVKFQVVSQRLGVLQPVAHSGDGDQVLVRDHPLEELVETMTTSLADFCALLGHLARDDQWMTTAKIFDKEIVRQALREATMSLDERAAFQGLRALWNFAFNSHDNQRVALEIVGAPALVRHLGHVNRTVRLRAGGVCWTVTHNLEGRAALIAAGVTDAAVALFFDAATARAWGLVHIAIGILANVTTEQTVEQVRLIADECQGHFIGTTPSGTPVPAEVTEQALRLVSLVINSGAVDAEWQREGFKFFTSAPKAG